MYNKEQLLNQINDIFEATGNERKATWNVIDEWEARKQNRLLNLLNQELYNKEQLLNQINDIFEATGNERKATWNVIDEWEARKQNRLLNLLNQELIIEKEISFSKPEDEIAEEIYAARLPERIRNAFRKEFFNEDSNNLNTSVVSHAAKLMLHAVTGSYALAQGKLDRDYILEKPLPGVKQTKFQKGTKITRVLRLLIDDKEELEKILVEYSRFFNQAKEKPLPGVKQTKFQKGTKITRVLRLLIDDKEELEKILVEYSRFFNQAKLKGTLCISIHPIDYLTASLNKCNWRSCFNLVSGEWKSSLGGLMASPYTMIAYLKAKDDMNYNGFVWNVWNNKQWRTYITINAGQNISHFHIGKHYPYCNEELESQLVSMMSDLLGGDNKQWRTYITINAGQNISHFHIGKHYPYCNEELESQLVSMMSDLLGGEFELRKDSYTFYTEVDEDGFYDDGVENVYARVGLEELENNSIPVAEDVMCLCCGDIYTNCDSNTIYCDDCYPSYYACCYECGELENNSIPVAEDVMCLCCGDIYTNCDSNTIYCDDCYPSYYACCYECGDRITHDDVDNGYYYYAEDTDRYFCSCCGEGRVRYCECCGYDLEETPVHEVKTEGRTYPEYWCEDCIDKCIHTYDEEEEVYIIKE